MTYFIDNFSSSAAARRQKERMETLKNMSKANPEEAKNNQ
jgi:hypothetical protein